MSSRQERRVDRAEAAAKIAVSELERAREEVGEPHRGGVLGNIFKTRGTSLQKEEERRAREGKEKVGEYKDKAVETAVDAKDATVRKMEEYKDATEEKAKEGKDFVVEKATEGKDSALGMVTRAMNYLTEKREDALERRMEEEEEEAKKDVERAQESANQKMVNLKFGAEESKDKAENNAKKAETEAATNAQRSGILSSLKDKIIGQKDTGEQNRPLDGQRGRLVEEKHIKVVQDVGDEKGRTHGRF